MRKLLIAILFAAATVSLAAPPPFAPDRKAGEGEGPWTRLVIRGVTLVDGTGAPPIGPVDIVIEGNRIREVRSVGFPKVPIKPESRPKDAVKEIDGTGLWVLPGFIDMHGHAGGEEQGTTAEYVFKLWMASRAAATASTGVSTSASAVPVTRSWPRGYFRTSSPAGANGTADRSTAPSRRASSCSSWQRRGPTESRSSAPAILSSIPRSWPL